MSASLLQYCKNIGIIFTFSVVFLCSTEVFLWLALPKLQALLAVRSVVTVGVSSKVLHR